MDSETTLATWDVLKSFGFQPNPDVMFSDIMPGLKFNFGNFTLSAICCINMQFIEIVSLRGVYKTERTVFEIDIQMPRQVESHEQCAAWIAYYLDDATHGRSFAYEPPWLSEGRKYKHLLPWVRVQEERKRKDEEYRARPHCTVEREWLKLALKALAKHLESVTGAETVEIGFDGKVLSFRLSENIVVSVAEGSPWKSNFTLPAEKLRPLPKRLMYSKVDVSIWNSKLQIDRSRYDGIVETT